MTIEIGNETYSSTSEIFADFDIKFKKEHPMLYWIDNKLFKNIDGIAGFAPHCIISCPWKIVEKWLGEVKWGFQRMFRGWDDRVIWSIDHHLAKRMCEWIPILKEKKKGVAFDFFTDEALKHSWDLTDEEIEHAKGKQDEAYDKISEGFREYVKINDLGCQPSSMEYEVARKKFDEGMELFVKHFSTLWD